jgi:tRNA A-37 threonylcarbamoyl transferase component Bud32
MGAGANNLVVVYFKDATPVDAIHMVALKKASANVKKAMKCVHREKRLRGGGVKKMETSGKKTSNYKKGMVGAAAVVGTVGLAALGRHLYLKNRTTPLAVPSLQLSLHPTELNLETQPVPSLETQPVPILQTQPAGQSLESQSQSGLESQSQSGLESQSQQAVPGLESQPSLKRFSSESHSTSQPRGTSSPAEVDQATIVTDEQIMLERTLLNNKCFTNVKKIIGETNTQHTRQIRQSCTAQFNETTLQIGQELGHGQFGAVYSVDNNENVVIKEQKGLCYTFINEIRCLELCLNFDDTQIVPEIYDAYVCFPQNIITEDVTNIEVTYGYVMEKMDKTLYTYLLEYIDVDSLGDDSKHVLSDIDVKTLCDRITLICEMLDSVDILHRDMTLENFMFDKQQNLKIIDFGLAYNKVAHQRGDYDSYHTYLQPLNDESIRSTIENLAFFVNTTMKRFQELSSTIEDENHPLLRNINKILHNLPDLDTLLK